MKKRAVVAFLVGCMLVVLGGLWFSRTPPEPMYKGRPLSEWLTSSGIFFSASKEQTAAVQAIGPEAIPWLLWITEHERVPGYDYLIPPPQPELRDKVLAWFTGRPPHIPVLYEFDEKPGILRQHALWALGVVGREDERVIRYARSLLEDPDRSEWACWLLTVAGEEHREFLREVSKTNPKVAHWLPLMPLVLASDQNERLNAVQ